MKVYIIRENEQIRAVTANKSIAEKICDAFGCYGVKYEEFTLLDEIDTLSNIYGIK